MKNPCDICVVKACCRTICKGKYDYSEYINQKLRNLWPHLYSINGHHRKHIPTTIKKEKEIYMKRFDKTFEEMVIIIDRNAPIV